MGFGGPVAGPVQTWVGPSGSAQLDRVVFFFFGFIFNAKTIPENI
jgi:hypothetical protein